MDREKILFKMDEMECRKYTRATNEQNIKKINVPERVRVHLSRMSFNENIVSRIDVFKVQGENGDKDCIFVEIFAGNIEIAYQIFYSDVVVCINYRKDVNGNSYIRSFDVREAESYDYHDTEKIETKKETL